MIKQPDDLWVRYLANAGTLFWNGESGICIDAFCADEQQIYKDTPERLRQELLGQIAAGTLQCMIITHEHSDHFLRGDVLRAWEQNRSLLIFTTSEVKKRIAEVIPENQIIVPDARRWYQPQWYHMNGYKIGLVYTVHEGAQYAEVQNLAVFIECRNRCIAVTGDAMPDEHLMTAIRAWKGTLDDLFLPFPLVGLKKNRRLLTAYLDIKNIFAYHLPRENVNVNWVNGAKEVCRTSDDGLPMPVFLERPGKWVQLG